jgi:hypothetical protein
MKTLACGEGSHEEVNNGTAVVIDFKYRKGRGSNGQ